MKERIRSDLPNQQLTKHSWPINAVLMSVEVLRGTSLNLGGHLQSQGELV